jgi:hypothetical protein
VITAVLGAPGSGKTAVAGPLAALLPRHAVLDWDALMEPATALAGRPIRQSPSTWTAYRDLVRAVIRILAPRPVVLLAVCTPSELPDWPINAWVLLDCADQERRQRLASDGRLGDIDGAIADARQYRDLGLPVIDTTGRTPSQVAAAIAQFAGSARPTD